MASIFEDLGEGIGDVLGGLSGANKTASAAQSIAEQQASAAERWHNEALGFAAPTASELMAQQSQLSLYNDALNFQHQILGQKFQSSLQSLYANIGSISQGELAPYLAPLLKQLEISRQGNDNSLQAAMGPGYASSSAGMQAQALFGNQAGQAIMGAQQNALGALSGAAASQVNSANNIMKTTSGIGTDYASMLGAIQNRQASTAMGTPLAGYAGANSTAALLKGQSQQQMFNQGAGMGAAALMAA